MVSTVWVTGVMLTLLLGTLMLTKALRRRPKALAWACAAVPVSGLLPNTNWSTSFVSLAVSESGTTVLRMYWRPSPQQVLGASGLKQTNVIAPVGAVASTSNVIRLV